MSWILILLITSFVVSYIYWRALPKPLPGIPYNHQSAKRISGDLPGLLSHIKRTKEVASFSFQQCHELNSPIIQLFLRPFSRPFVWLNDPREIEDILLRRPKQFDRAPSTIAMFKPLVPHASMVKTTNDDFKTQRRLWQDVMSPAFLRSVVAPNVHKPLLDLVELWRMKSKHAGGHPFEALDDLEITAFDAIWVAILGSKLKETQDRIVYLRSCPDVKLSNDIDEAVQFPSSPRSAMFNAIAYMNSTIEMIMRSPFPKQHHWLIRQTRTYKMHDSFKEREIMNLVYRARERYEHLSQLSEDEFSDQDSCAMDLVLRREAIAIRKGGAPSGNLELRDELGMLLVAGHETTAVTLGWALKSIARNQKAQSKLRDVFRSAFANATPQALPGSDDILSTNIPYLDGFLEEILRHANTVPLLVRASTTHTQILSHHIPPGTHIMCNAQFMDEFLPIPEAQRSPTSQSAFQRRTTPFNTQDLSKFWPERWLERNAKGEDVFQPQALTRLAFSLGARGCFGKRLAMQSLRIMIVVLVMSFEFLELPEGLDCRFGQQKILCPPQQCYVRIRAL